MRGAALTGAVGRAALLALLVRSLARRAAVLRRRVRPVAPLYAAVARLRTVGPRRPRLPCAVDRTLLQRTVQPVVVARAATPHAASVLRVLFINFVIIIIIIIFFDLYLYFIIVTIAYSWRHDTDSGDNYRWRLLHLGPRANVEGSPMGTHQLLHSMWTVTPDPILSPMNTRSSLVVYPGMPSFSIQPISPVAGGVILKMLVYPTTLM